MLGTGVNSPFIGAVPLVSDVGGIVDSTVKAVRERIGDVQVLEESEEVRLALMSLATALVSRSPESAPLCVADLASICEKGSLDKFPDAKRAAAELAVILSDVVKSEVCSTNLISSCYFLDIHPPPVLNSFSVKGRV
jgi:hypothetical protein